MAGPLVERFRARCAPPPEPVCTPAFQTLVLPTPQTSTLPVSALFPISEHNRGDCYQRAVDISGAANVGALAGHGQYEGLRGFSITLPVGQTPSFDMVAIGNGNIGYGGSASNQPLYFGDPASRVTRQTTAEGGTVEWIHRGGDMPMAIAREVHGDQCTYRVWFMDQSNSSNRGGIVSLTQPDGSRRYNMVALDRIPPPPPAPVVATAPEVAPPPRPVAPPAAVTIAQPTAEPLLAVPPPRAVTPARRPSSDDPPIAPPTPPAVPRSDQSPAAPAVPRSDQPLSPPTTSLSADPFARAGFVDHAGQPFELSRVPSEVAQQLNQRLRSPGESRDGIQHVALDANRTIVELPRTEGSAAPTYLLVENRGTAEVPELWAASVSRNITGRYRRNGDAWQLYFGASVLARGDLSVGALF